MKVYQYCFNSKRTRGKSFNSIVRNQTASIAVLLVIVFSNTAIGSLYKSVTIREVPHVKQKPDFCGEACVEMYTRKLGAQLTQDDIFNLSGVDPIDGRGCRTPELAKTLKSIGFDVGDIWYKVSAKSAGAIKDQWESLHADLLKGTPSIVCMRTGTTQDATEHFRLVLGYDAEKDEVIFHEPAEKDAAYRRMKLEYFLKCWPLKYSSEKWTIIKISLKAEKVRGSVKAQNIDNARYAQHMMELKKKIPPKGFAIIIQKPFVVIGNDSPERVKFFAEQTVKWSTEKLKALYFEKDPEDIIDIWLFKDNDSYRKYTWEIFNDKPGTPFGYSSPENKALIMNIGTGGGTLVHEIVHPFIAANFPDCPAWFNEGLGSLYEQSSERSGKIVGLTNWRLKGLQDAIKKKKVPSFEALMSTTEYEFYNEDKGTNYAQARYLCYYLQEKKLLVRFYREFRADREKDPTGYETLKKVLGEKDMNAFKKKWEQYVLSLRFR
ncbi:C39 family peptidase [Verrucomicrobiota bacterium]